MSFYQTLLLIEGDQEQLRLFRQMQDIIEQNAQYAVKFEVNDDDVLDKLASRTYRQISPIFDKLTKYQKDLFVRLLRDAYWYALDNQINMPESPLIIGHPEFDKQLLRRRLIRQNYHIKYRFYGLIYGIISNAVGPEEL